MYIDLMRIFHSSVLDGPVPAKALASEIGKPYSTLLRELNPYDTGAKLGVETMIAILKHTRDMTALEYIANHLGYSLTRNESAKSDMAPGFVVRKHFFH